MIDEYLSRCNLKPYDHQIVGIDALVKWDDPTKGRVIGGCFALFDEMGAGKTLQVSVAAQILFLMNKIDRVVVVAPVPVRSVWFDPELGELKKHLWPDLPVWVTEYHARKRKWTQGTPGLDKRILRWVVTNYDFLRAVERREQLSQVLSKRTLLVLDESSAIKNPSAKQSKAMVELRRLCGRVFILNGTPIANNPGDLFNQAYTMDPTILECRNFFHFRSKYAIMGGWQGRQVLSWRNVEDIQRRMAPYILRRLKVECLDLPAKLDSVVLKPTLTQKTWGIYKEMRDDMVAWLTEDTVATASQSIVRVLRLSQITSGFLSGVQQGDVDYAETADGPEEPGKELKINLTEEIGREKLDLFLAILKEWVADDPDLKLIVWCRFRAELKRLHATLFNGDAKIQLGQIWGGQKRHEREAAIRLLDPRTSPKGPVVVMGTPATGAMGLNLTAAHTVVYLSNDYSLKTRLQSEDRVHRPGQIYPVSYFDVVAEGPNGQKTIDHAILKALKEKDDMAKWTTSAWLSALRDE